MAARKKRVNVTALIPKIEAMMRSQGVTAADACKALGIPTGSFYRARLATRRATKPAQELAQMIAEPAPRRSQKLTAVMLIGDADEIAKAMGRFAAEHAQ